MKAILNRIAAFAVAAILAGCSGHSYPIEHNFIVPPATDAATARRAEVFVDANGTFYPDAWNSYVAGTRRWKAHSLLNQAAVTPGLYPRLASEEARQLRDIAAFGRNKKRLFILVHGYNNTAERAIGPYDSIEARLDLHEDDGVIRFHWDGLTGDGIGAGKIWFNATAYSQMAGAHGLRRILAQFEDKQIYLISHSRGGSVILSALGNPVFDPKFKLATEKVAATWTGDYSKFLSPDPLPMRGNRIHIIAAAPSIDRIDFCDAHEQANINNGGSCEKLRSLGPQFCSLSYTVNPRDPVLNKFVGLSKGFNPTGLGLRASVGEDIAKEGRYRGMRAYAFPDAERFHAFERYVRHPTFAAMLFDQGILKPGIPHPLAMVAPSASSSCPGI